jgi:hypothetical protein
VELLGEAEGIGEPDTPWPDVPLPGPLADPRTVGSVDGITVLLAFGCCGRTAERSSIWRRCRLGAELSIRLRSTEEFATSGAADVPTPFVMRSRRGGSPRTVSCWMRMLSGMLVPVGVWVAEVSELLGGVLTIVL